MFWVQFYTIVYYKKASSNFLSNSETVAKYLSQHNVDAFELQTTSFHQNFDYIT